MANVKISDLPAASTPLTGAELVPIVQSGVTSQTAVDNLLNPLAETNGSSLVAYLPSGTNAVATTVQAKLRERVSVFDFIPSDQIAYIQANNTASQNGTVVTAGIQAAITAHKSVFFPAGTYKITSPIILSQNNFQITGIYGKSILMGGGGGNIFGYFKVNTLYTAEFGIIENLIFDSDDPTKARTAIASDYPNGVYLARLRISNCNFNGRLTGGIYGCLINSHIDRCTFGVNATGYGNTLKAIYSKGLAVPPTYASTNINIIEQCEFSNCGSPDAIVEFEIGYKLVFRDCVFEQLTPLLAVVLLSGIEYPVFDGCWFENAQGTTTSGKCVIVTKTALGLFAEVLTVNECLFHTYSTIPEGLINFGDSPRKVAHFTKNFIANLQSPIIVGGNSVATFVDTFGNAATVGAGGDATGFQYDSPAKFDLGVSATTVSATNVTSGLFKSDTSITNVANTATTIYTFPTVAGETRFYLVSVASYQGAAATYGAFAVVNTDLGTASIQISHNSAGMTLSLSGMDLQATTSSSTDISVECSIVRIK